VVLPVPAVRVAPGQASAEVRRRRRGGGGGEPPRSHGGGRGGGHGGPRARQPPRDGAAAARAAAADGGRDAGARPPRAAPHRGHRARRHGALHVQPPGTTATATHFLICIASNDLLLLPSIDQPSSSKHHYPLARFVVRPEMVHRRANLHFGHLTPLPLCKYYMTKSSVLYLHQRLSDTHLLVAKFFFGFRHRRIFVFI